MRRPDSVGKSGAVLVDAEKVVNAAIQGEAQSQHLQVGHDAPLRFYPVDVEDRGVPPTASQEREPGAEGVLGDLLFLAPRFHEGTRQVLAVIGGTQAGGSVGHGFNRLRRDGGAFAPALRAKHFAALCRNRPIMRGNEIRELTTWSSNVSHANPEGTVPMQPNVPPQIDSVAQAKRPYEKREDFPFPYEVGSVDGAARASDAMPLVDLFEQIAREEGWHPGGELRAHISRSVYFYLRLGHDSPPDGSLEPEFIGALQLVLASATGSIPSAGVWPEVDFTARHRRIAHVAVLALRKEWRGRKDAFMLFWLLAVAMWRYCVREGIEELWLEATPRVLATYQRLGFPLTVRGELREHWGEPCFLASMTVREVAGALAEKAFRGSSSYRSILIRACLHDDM